MRKFKIGNVYSADCFNDRGEKVDRGDGYWHFKIIEVVRGYQNRKGYNIYIGIKVDMNDYQKPSTNYLVESFNSDGVSLDGERYHFKLKRNITEKKGMDAWKVSFDCQNRSDGYENTHRKATGSSKYELKTAPERAQGHLEQQEAGK